MRVAIGDAKTCPHGHPIKTGDREQGALLADCEVGAKVTILRFENEAEELLHYLRDAGFEPGSRRRRSSPPMTPRSSSPPRDGIPRRLVQRRRDGLRPRRPGAAAPLRAARAARALARPLRSLRATRHAAGCPARARAGGDRGRSRDLALRVGGRAPGSVSPARRAGAAAGRGSRRRAASRPRGARAPRGPSPLLQARRSAAPCCVARGRRARSSRMPSKNVIGIAHFLPSLSRSRAFPTR